MTALLSVADAARELGLDESRVRVLIRTGRIKATRLGARTWAIPPRALDPVRVRKPGRPPSSPSSAAR
jgi:excisionase family DNA binding protein